MSFEPVGPLRRDILDDGSEGGLYDNRDRLILRPPGSANAPAITVDSITAVNATTLGLVDGDVIQACGRTTAGDGGGGTFRYVAASTQTVDGGLVFQPTAGSGRLFRDGWTVVGFSGDVSALWFGVQMGVVSASVAQANALALEAAVTSLGALAGGKICIPAGRCQVRLDPANYSDSSATYRVAAIRVGVDNIAFCGAGLGVTSLEANDSTGLYSIFQMLKVPLVNGVSQLTNCSVSDMTIDGGFGTPSGLEPSQIGSGISAAGWKNCSLRRLHIKNCANYAIGLQNGGYLNNTLDSIICENTGADAIDVKDNPPSGGGAAISRGNSITNLTIRNFGQWTNVGASFAGLDLLGQGWRVNGVYITDYGSAGTIEAAIRFKQGIPTDSRGDTPEFSTLLNFCIEQTSSTVAAKGILCKSPFVSISTGTMTGIAGNGVELEQSFATVSGVVARGVTAAGSRAFVANDKSDAISVYAGADDVTFSNCVAFGFETGLYSQRTRVTFNANTVDTCTNGVVVTGASGAANRLLFNSVRNTTTPLTTTNSTSHQYVGNTGIASPMIGSQTTGGAAGLFYFSTPDSFRFYTSYAGVAGTWGAEQLRITNTASADNYFSITGSAGGPPILGVAGASTDIDVRITTKGTGVLRFGTHTSNADAPITGFITIKDNGGTSRKLAVIA